MQIRKRAFAAVFSFLSSLFAVWTTYRYAEPAGGVKLLCAFYIVGFLLGCVHGLLFGRNNAKIVGYGAFVAVLLLWTPVMFVTYGFAIIGIPFLIAYAACITVGAQLVTKNRDCNTCP